MPSCAVPQKDHTSRRTYVYSQKTELTINLPAQPWTETYFNGCFYRFECEGGGSLQITAHSPDIGMVNLSWTFRGDEMGVDSFGWQEWLRPDTPIKIRKKANVQGTLKLALTLPATERNHFAELVRIDKA